MSDTSPTVDAAPLGQSLRRASLTCEVCGEETEHRLLVVQTFAGGRRLSGTARCAQCRTTHRFDIVAPRTRPIRAVVSSGRQSTRMSVPLPESLWLSVGESAEGLPPETRIRRIDRRDGRSARSAPVREIETLWLLREGQFQVPVSIVEGATTRASTWNGDPSDRLHVGMPLMLDRVRWTVHALRARGRTWREPEDGFEAREVERIYARRTEIPPAGRRDWSRSRDTPSSRASSASRSPRSRSSPGASRNRNSPRERTAEFGATLQSSVPS